MLCRKSLTVFFVLFSDLLAGWQGLREQISKMQAFRDLQKEVMVLKSELKRRWHNSPLITVESATVDELSRDIDAYTVRGFAQGRM